QTLREGAYRGQDRPRQLGVGDGKDGRRRGACARDKAVWGQHEHLCGGSPLRSTHSCQPGETVRLEGVRWREREATRCMDALWRGRRNQEHSPSSLCSVTKGTARDETEQRGCMLD